MSIEEEIQSSFSSERHKALVNLIYTNYYVSDKMKAYFKGFNITTQQFNILRILRGQHPKPASIRLIKERMLDKSSDVSRILDRLLKKEWIIRTDCQVDRRQKDILITEKGLNLLKTIDEFEEKRDDLLSELSNEEVHQLNQLLDKIRNS